MPRGAPHFFETTVFEPTRGAEASRISVPANVLRQATANADALLNDPVLLADALDVRLGVPLRTPDDVPEVFFASMAGRVTPFDQFSAERWRAQRLNRLDTPEAQFAIELATMEFVAIEESPLNGSSLTSLITRGAGYTIGGWEAMTGHPFMGLGVLIVGQFGFVIAQVTRAVGDEAYLIARYHARRLRRLFGVPEDWNP
jgi:hypothetical protein